MQRELAIDCATISRRLRFAVCELQLREHSGDEFARRRDQHHLRDGVVFGLRQQIGRDKSRVRRIVGDHQDFGGSGRQIDGGAAGSAATICLAAVTQALPGPKILSTLRTLSVPKASAAIACAPPIL